MTSWIFGIRKINVKVSIDANVTKLLRGDQTCQKQLTNISKTTNISENKILDYCRDNLLQKQ